MGLGPKLQKPFSTTLRRLRPHAAEERKRRTTPLGRSVDGARAAVVSGCSVARLQVCTQSFCLLAGLSPMPRARQSVGAPCLVDERMPPRRRRAALQWRCAASGWPRTFKRVSCPYSLIPRSRMQRSAHLASALEFGPRSRLLRWPSSRVGRPRPRPGALQRLHNLGELAGNLDTPAGAPSNAPDKGLATDWSTSERLDL
jgi:hypothetical protein